MTLKTKNKIIFGICIVLFIIAVIVNIEIVKDVLSGA